MSRWRHPLLILAAALMLLPILWAALVSTRPQDAIIGARLLTMPSLDAIAANYGRAVTASPLFGFIGNGIAVCSLILFFQVLIMVPAGYALAKLRFPGRETLWGGVLLGLMVPAPVLAMPLFVMVAMLGLMDSLPALVLPWVVSSLGIFLMRQFFRRVPDEIIEAARLDGLSELELLVRVLLPLARPTLGAFAIISLVAHWNELYWPSIVVTSAERATPPFGVMLFQTQEAGTEYGALMAGALIIALPLVAAFLLLQRRFIEGLVAMK
ncbi:carbohydrate ABC transporter permease [Rhodovarius crocodyli]|uniref:Carbohydrate ABC transporter permease n=1 Tax=Rhodovarius crocodyli TaxID=1979269 RepID=A0A437M2S4_9PROT|nr:carbohydrate ABC transporter permease [Rhodovarius crocodyli]RVT92000.1 carbohydrate ABC transporter permease [Rhodovarius crocodyli]